MTRSGASPSKSDAISLTKVVGARTSALPGRALYHDDALLCTVAAQQEILPPDDLVRVFERVTSGPVYQVEQTSMTAIDDVACVVTGRIRYPLPGGGFGEDHRAWLLTYKDGLLFRSCAYTSTEKRRLHMPRTASRSTSMRPRTPRLPRSIAPPLFSDGHFSGPILAERAREVSQ